MDKILEFDLDFFTQYPAVDSLFPYPRRQSTPPQTQPSRHSAHHFQRSVQPFHNKGPVKMSADGRQRLRPWLQSKLDSGLVPGVQWKNKEEGIFQLPWKHGGKQDWSEKDSLIFKEWAIHTGRFREGIDKEDWSTWKTRLRCALNKLPDIEEMKELSKLEEPSPYRVYRFLPLQTDNASAKKLSCRMEVNSEFLPAQEVSCCDAPQNIPTTVRGQSLGRSMSLPEEGVAMEVDDQHPGCGDGAQHGRSDLVVEESLYPTDTHTGAPMGCFGQPEALPYNQSMNQLSVAKAIQGLPPDHQMHITLRFGSLDAQTYKVENPKGCRLYFGPGREGSSVLGDTGVEIYGPPDVDQLKIPPCPDQSEATTQQFTNTLLNVLDRGLVLETYKGDIYATRLCRCVVFVHSSSLRRQLGTDQPLRLKRNSKWEKIFDFNEDFMAGFRRYLMRQGPPPSPEIQISFGQRWDTQAQDIRGLLISATITHAKAFFMLHQISSSGISSLHISSEDDYDAYVNHYKQVASVNWSDSFLQNLPQQVQ